ncbi:LGFP repeat-containing protein [Kocuria sp. KH4]
MKLSSVPPLRALAAFLISGLVATHAGVPAAAAPSSTASSGATSTTGFITGYTIHDNDPAGSKAIAYSSAWEDRAVHSEAGGTGTYADPITLAAQIGDYAPGTRFYLPHVKRYFVLEDTCADCGQKPEWIDMWIGGDPSDSAAATTRCAESLTGYHDFEVHPPAGRPVVTGPLFNSATDTCYTAGAPSTTPSPSSGTTVVGGYELKGAIGAKWKALGGIAWGRPIGSEATSGYSSSYQRFIGTDGRTRAIYWSSATGAHAVDYGGDIGLKFAAGGYAGTYGPPSTEKIRLAGGGYAQDFRAGATRTRILWSPRTGAKVVTLTGAIGTRWASLGAQNGLGYPTRDKYRTASGWSQTFTTGRIDWNATTKATTVIRY